MDVNVSVTYQINGNDNTQNKTFTIIDNQLS